MRYTLKDYQTEAVRDVLKNLEIARDNYHRHEALSQFSLAATTGAGKTVMAAAIIESLFFGNDEFNFEPDPGAVVLWFSDDPSLNEQSRARIQTAASELDYRLRTIPSNFSEEEFKLHNVYFLNTQKMASHSRLVKGTQATEDHQPALEGMPSRPDIAQTSIFDTITNTVRNENRTLYLVLDEAHRGMGKKADEERTTIVQRLINGQGTVPPMPIVFGISATVERFKDTMKKIKSRHGLQDVEVDSTLVQASGLLKDDIALSIPAESGEFQNLLLKKGVEKIRASTKAWAEYAQQQSEDEIIKPLLVVQMGDKPTDEQKAETLATIFDAWPELPHGSIANVFGERKDFSVGQELVPYIEPQRVQETPNIRVLLAKSAISTGWDCPRAEVLVSFRPAKDVTHITQLLGRMIRTPLARRIPGNELLNSVDCLLPYFDRSTATKVAEKLMKGAAGETDDDGDDAGGGKGRRVLFSPVSLLPNEDVSKAVREKFAELPTVSIPKKNVKPIRRLTQLATALAKDSLVTNAGAQAHQVLHAALDGRAVQYQDKVNASREDVLHMRGTEVRGRIGGGLSYDSFALTADPRAIEEYYRAATRIFSPALCDSYVDKLAGADGDEDELLEAHIQIAALARVPEIAEAIDEEAGKLTRKWLTETRVARKNLKDERKAEYERIESLSTEPERVSLAVPETAQAETKIRKPDGSEESIPTWGMHLMVNEGVFPAVLNEWEQTVLKTEMDRPGFQGWYRNPDRATQDSLAVAYKDELGDWKAMRPDFIFFSTAHDGGVAVDLVDPHGHHLSDALPKLRGLADFVEQFGEEFRRIESVAKTGDTLRVIDITSSPVRSAIREASSARALYESDLAYDY